jgi:cytoskeletal protein RodZ
MIDPNLRGAKMMGIGALLQQERQRRGLSLDDVESATKIRTRYIQAMETEDFAVIPGEVYRLGFLKNYARLLGLNQDAIVAQYKADRQGAVNDEDLTATLQPVAVAEHSVRDESIRAVAGRETEDRSSAHGGNETGARRTDTGGSSSVQDGQAMEKRQDVTVYQHSAGHRAGKRSGKVFSRRRLLAGAAAVVVLLLLAVVVHAAVFRAVRPTSTNKPPAAPAKSVSSLVYSQPQSLQIRLVGTGHCWAEVKVDGKEAYMGTIAPGETEAFTAKVSIWLDLGYPASVDVYYNGTKLPPLGTTTLVSRTFTNDMGVETH